MNLQKGVREEEMRDILIVEDSPTQAEKLKYILEQHDYQVSVTKQGQQALAWMEKRKPVLVISDIMMPEMDGYQLCRRIKEDNNFKDVPVILLTSLSDPVDVIKGLECGADNFITKPYDENYLLSRIQYILINRKLYKSDKMQMGIEIFFAGQKYFITSERQQILNLLLSTYETAVQKNLELIRARNELKLLNEHLEEMVEERTTELRAEISERKRAEVAMRESVARMTALLENLNVGVLFEDSLRRVLHVNPKFCEIFGLNPEIKWVGANSDEIAAVAKWLFTDPQAFVELTKKRLANGAMVVAEEMVLKDDRTVESDYIPVNVGKEHRGHLWLYRDISERKRAEEALRQSEEQLRQSQKMEAVGRLAGGIAHDFNNLLTAIIGYGEILLNKLGDRSPLSADILEIKKAGERAATLTRQLLAFSRKQVLQPRVLNLNDVVTGMENMLRRLIGEDIDFVTHPDPALGQVKADPGGIEQVILNLVVNARDAMPVGGKLTIETANVDLDQAYARDHVAVQPGPYVMLAVSDSGIGMTAEVRSHLFEPFFTTKEEGKGTGLGLSTTYGIVKQSGGNIWVYSELGRGATFKIYLPHVEEAVVPVEAKLSSAETKKACETILVVEDEEVIRRLVCSILQEHGYTLLDARNGSEALMISERHAGPIHLMLTDVVMPQMGVRELTQAIARSRPQTRVLYVSGYTDDAIIHHGVLDEGMHFIQKPFTTVALSRKVREVLDQP
ncbi:MAG: hybrid sensor histidine kinase/response regulator [Acidobacteria bacterium]|nr:MAG: hybrid sensor histidine kinase/response regulator [Acidobacteriota bacterium]